MDPAPFVEATRELRGRFFTLLESLSAVRALASLDVQGTDTPNLLQQALDILSHHQDLERCSAFLLEGDELTCVAGMDFPESMGVETHAHPAESATRSHRIHVGHGLMGKAAREGIFQYSPDCLADPRCEPVAETRPSGSLMCGPVIDGGEVLGVINVYHPEPHHFEEWHQHILFVFCGILAHLLSSQKALQHLEELVRARTRELQTTLTETQRLKQRFEELSTVDELTALHNRRFFFSEADAALARAVRHRQDFCLLIIDLDHFKQVNDSYGHSMGDQVLRDVARALLKHTREGDILARFGGEEFVLALPDTPENGSMTLARRIQDHLKAHSWEVDGKPFSVSISVGVTCLPEGVAPEEQPHLDELLRQADRAMYYSKDKGRDQVHSYQELVKTENGDKLP